MDYKNRVLRGNKCIECNNKFNCDYYMHDYIGSSTPFTSKRYCEELEKLKSFNVKETKVEK